MIILYTFGGVKFEGKAGYTRNALQVVSTVVRTEFAKLYWMLFVPISAFWTM
jgi:hypothetical protein